MKNQPPTKLALVMYYASAVLAPLLFIGFLTDFNIKNIPALIVQTVITVGLLLSVCVVIAGIVTLLELFDK